MKLCKSYRSTYEITQFAQRISPNPDLVAIERHGDPPQILRCANTQEEIERIIGSVRAFTGSSHNTLGIICKTQPKAERAADAIRDAGPAVHLLTAESTSFTSGVTVCSAHMAKGLEFDEVIVPDAGDKTYRTAMDRNLLYVACTRAMHRLTLTYTGKPSPWVPD